MNDVSAMSESLKNELELSAVGAKHFCAKKWPQNQQEIVYCSRLVIVDCSIVKYNYSCHVFHRAI